MPLSKSQLYVIMTASLVYFYQGYVHAIFNGLITMDSFLDRFPETNTLIGTESEKHHAALLRGTVVAILDIGSTIGSLLCSWLGDKLGRRKLVHITVAVAFAGVLLQITAFAYIQLNIGRVLSGIGLGCFSATVPMWLAECLNASNRGKISIFTGAFVTIGFVVAAWIDFGFYYADTKSFSWRLPIALQFIPLLAITGACFGTTESPRWLVKRNSIIEAIKALSELKGCDEDDDSVHEEIADIQYTASRESNHSLNSESTKAGYRAFLAIWLCILVTLSGINVISFFSTEMFETQLDFSPARARLLSAGLQMVQLVFAFLACFLVELWGRRISMMVSAASLTVSMACLGGFGSMKGEAAISLSVFFQFFTMVGYPVGFHSIPYMYCAEIAPLLNRHMITSTSSAAHWLFNFGVAEITPFAFGNIGSSYYYVYMAINMCTLASLYFLYPETKGFQLEAIDTIFTCSNNPLEMVEKSHSLPHDLRTHKSFGSFSTTGTMAKRCRHSGTSRSESE